MRDLRWGDLLSPREVYAFTLVDAWGALPTMLAMAGFFFVGAIIIWLVKRALLWLFLRRYMRRRYALRRHESIELPGGGTRVRRRWREVPTHTYGTLMHVLIELMAVAGIVVVVYFTCSVGNVNVWQHSTSMSIILGIVSIVFMPALQQFGAGAIVLLTCKVAHGEYYEIDSTRIEGRVGSMSMWDVEFEAADPTTGGAVFHLVPMATILTATLTRNMRKEDETPRVTRWGRPTPKPPHTVYDPSNGDEDLFGAAGDDDTQSSCNDDGDDDGGDDENSSWHRKHE